LFFSTTLEGRSQVERDELVVCHSRLPRFSLSITNKVRVRKMMVITLTLIGLLIAMGDRLN
jgi:hypothetical protein